MDLQKYIITVLIVQSVRSNSISGKWELEIPENTRTDIEHIGDKSKGNNNDVYALIKREDITSADNGITSSDLLHFLVTSQSSSGNSVVRTRRSSSRKSKKSRCKPDDKSCKSKRKKNKNKTKRERKKKRKCKKKGRKRKCKKRVRKPPPVNDRLPKLTTTHQPGPNSTYVPDGWKCVRSSSCPPGYCCARHHFGRICRPLLKENDICTRKSKYRRNLEYFERCPCEENLTCRKEMQVDKDGRRSTSRPSLYKCVSNT